MIRLKNIIGCTFIFLNLLLAFPGTGFSQTRAIKGTVKDNNGETLPGSSILVAGTNRGTVADVNGNFTINVSPADKIKVSFVGYISQTIEVGRMTTLNVVLLPDASKSLEEVVVVGYGQQRKVSVVGAISSVSARELRQSPAANVSNALGGRLPGLVTIQASGEPGADVAQMYIRGVSTFTGSQAPLVLVDGIERDLRLLNVEEIETISILKDASATAVYGVRGANGVILVTTKRGFEGKPQIDLTANLGFQTPTRLPKMVNSYEMAVLTNEAEINDGIFPSYSQEALDAYKNGTDPYNYPNDNWFKESLNNIASEEQYNLAISGGDKFTKYYVSTNIVSQGGLYKYGNYNPDYSTNVSYTKYNFRSNVDFQLSKIFQVKLNLAGIIGTKHSPNWDATTVFDRMRVSNPNRAPVRNPDGTWATEEKSNFNPLANILDGGYADSKETAIQATMGMRADLASVTPGLSANINYSFDFNNTYSKHYTTGSIDMWRFMDDGSYELFTTGQPLGFGDNLDTYTSRYVLEPSLSYNKKMGSHELTGLILYNQTEFLQKSGNAIQRLPYRRMGIAGRGTYSFRDTYFAELNMGYNGSENFAPGHRFGFFPAVSAGWVLSNEDFFNLDAINYLKIRGSYGLVGNDQIGGDRFLYLSLYGGSGGADYGYPRQGSAGTSESRIGNMGLTWEKAKKINLGFDLRAFKDKLETTIDVFYEDRNHILTNVGIVPATYGGPSIITNDGEVKNKGFEAEFTYRGTADNNFRYYYGGNFSFARNKIVSIPEAPRKYDYQLTTGTRIGQPFGYISTGLFQSKEEILQSPPQFGLPLQPGDVKYMDVNGDGVVDSFDALPVGNPHVPEIFYSLKLGFTFKGFDFSCMFQGSANSTYYFYSGQNVPFSNENNTPLAVWMDRWTPDNRDAAFPRMAYTHQNSNNFQTSSFWQMSANYFRFKQAEVGYVLPSGLVRRLGASSARVYANSINLVTWSKVPVYDPENDSAQYPIMTVINTGLRLTF